MKVTRPKKIIFVILDFDQITTQITFHDHTWNQEKHPQYVLIDKKTES